MILIFLMLPFLEVYGLVELSGEFGWPKTLGYVVLSFLAGSWLLRTQGVRLWVDLQQIQQKGGELELPLLKSLLTSLGALGLMAPGLITDVVGATLILPVTQWLWIQFFKHRIQRWVREGRFQVVKSYGGVVYHSRSNSPNQPEPSSHVFPGDSDVIDISVKKRLD